MPSFPNKVKLAEVTALKSTDKALLCEIDGEQVWIPQSHIDDDSEVFKDGDVGTLVISEWIAKQKSLV